MAKRTTRNPDGLETVGVSPKATAATGGATLGGALAVLILWLIPGAEPAEVAVAISAVASAVLAFAGARLAGPGLVEAAGCDIGEEDQR